MRFLILLTQSHATPRNDDLDKACVSCAKGSSRSPCRLQTRLIVTSGELNSKLHGLTSKNAVRRSFNSGHPRGGAFFCVCRLRGRERDQHTNAWALISSGVLAPPANSCERADLWAMPPARE